MEPAVLASRAVKACIDHHLDPAPFADHYLVDDGATSTGEIIFRLLSSLAPGNLSPTAATALYCAIMTDTGSFRYPRVGAGTHRIIAQLIDAGADPVGIYSLVYERWSPGRIHLAGEMLAGLQLLADGRLAHVSVSREMLRRTGTTEEDTDNFTTYPMSLAGVVAGILFLELEDGVKISFRSRGSIPIHELAREFGGNGHRNAAGARVNGGTLADTRNAVLAAALKYVESQPESR
jgi:phosphoesterase RecJ-like protein